MKRISAKYLLFWLGLLLIVPIILPFFDSRVMTFHDETQFANLHQYIKAIDSGQFPPRWAPDMQYTYGSPFLEFNYQLPYYLAFILSKFGLSLIAIFKTLMVLSVVAGYIGFYLLAVSLGTPAIALVSSVIYSYSPYRAVNVFVRGSLGESMAFAIFPLVILFLLKIREKPTLRNLVWASLAIALLFLNHQPATILVLPFIFLFVLIDSFSHKNFKAIILQLLSGAFSLFLSAFYWLPVITEQKYLKSVSPFNFYDHFPFIKQLIFSKWGYGSSNWGIYDDMSFQIGLPNLVFLALTLFILVLFLLKIKKFKNIHLVGASLLIVFASLFLMNNRSTFFWNIFPFTQQIQFPWRLLMVPTLFTSIMAVFVLNNLTLKKEFKILLYSSIIILTILSSITYFRPGQLFQRDDSYFLYRFLPNIVLRDGESVSSEYKNHAEDYVVLPKWATRPQKLPESVITTDIENRVTIYEQTSYHIKAKLQSNIGGFVTINKFYFPGWVVTADGKITKVNLNQFGAMTIFVEKGNHNIEVKYVDTPIRFISNIISLTAAIIAILLLLYNSKNKRGRTK